MSELDATFLRNPKQGHVSLSFFFKKNKCLQEEKEKEVNPLLMNELEEEPRARLMNSAKTQLLTLFWKAVARALFDCSQYILKLWCSTWLNSFPWKRECIILSYLMNDYKVSSIKTRIYKVIYSEIYIINSFYMGTSLHFSWERKFAGTYLFHILFSQFKIMTKMKNGF